jgi:hypothetical protein
MLHKTMAVMAVVFVGFTLSIPAVANAGCDITIKIKNNHNDLVTVNWHKSEVKIKNGFWKKISSDLTGNKIQDSIKAGDTVSRVYGADFGCGKQRQYRFEVFSDTSHYWMESYPGGDTWTTKTTFTVKVKP